MVEPKWQMVYLSMHLNCSKAPDSTVLHVQNHRTHTWIHGLVILCHVLLITKNGVSALKALIHGHGQEQLFFEDTVPPTHRTQEFDLVHRCLCVMLGALHHLHCHKPLHPAATTTTHTPVSKQSQKDTDLSGIQCQASKHNSVCNICREDFCPYWMSQASHTVEKCPQPSFRITWYFPL